MRDLHPNGGTAAPTAFPPHSKQHVVAGARHGARARAVSEAPVSEDAERRRRGPAARRTRATARPARARIVNAADGGVRRARLRGGVAAGRRAARRRRSGARAPLLRRQGRPVRRGRSRAAAPRPGHQGASSPAPARRSARASCGSCSSEFEKPAVRRPAAIVLIRSVVGSGPGSRIAQGVPRARGVPAPRRGDRRATTPTCARNSPPSQLVGIMMHALRAAARAARERLRRRAVARASGRSIQWHLSGDSATQPRLLTASRPGGE